MHSNTFVAIKEISLAHIPREHLGGIMVRPANTILQLVFHPIQTKRTVPGAWRSKNGAISMRVGD